MRNPIKKVLFALVALALVSGLGFSGQAHGCTPLFSISITSITGRGGETTSPYTNPICLSGIASVTDFPGQLRQYQVQVDWGDGVVDTDSTVNFVQFGNSFWGTWSSDPCHSYSACGNYTIIARIYHQNPSGAESGDTEATIRLCVSYDLTVNSATGGSVINPGEGTFPYDGGSLVNIVASPNPCYQFVNWTGDVDTVGDVTAAATTITMNGDYSITANFEPNLPAADAGTDQEVCAGASVQIGGTATNGTPPYTYSWSPSEGLSDPTIANPTASPGENTTYTVTVTDAEGCQASDDVTVTVNPLPECTITAPTKVCAYSEDNSASVADAGTNATYSWTIDSGTITSATNATSITWDAGLGPTVTLQVTVTTEQGCSKSCSKQVTVNQKPVATASSTSPMCKGGNVTLTGGPDDMATYSWAGPNDYSSDQQSPVLTDVTLSDAGTYTLIVTITMAAPTVPAPM